jgi:hypothetical protein
MSLAKRGDFSHAAGLFFSVNREDGYSKYFTLLDALAIPYVAIKDRNWGDPVRYPANRFWSFGYELEEYLDRNGLADLRASVIAEVGTSDTKARVARVLPARLTGERVPGLFKGILQAAQNAAAGEPSEARVARFPLSVVVEPDGLTRGIRVDREIETAAYFVVCEGLTNTLKHGMAGDRSPGGRPPGLTAPASGAVASREAESTRTRRVASDGRGQDERGYCRGTGALRFCRGEERQCDLLEARSR